MRGKRANIEDMYLKIEWVDPTTPKGKESWNNGFRILAHMIAEAYLKDLGGKNKHPVEASADVDTRLHTLHPDICAREGSERKANVKS